MVLADGINFPAVHRQIFRGLSSPLLK